MSELINLQSHNLDSLLSISMLIHANFNLIIVFTCHLKKIDLLA